MVPKGQRLTAQSFGPAPREAREQGTIWPFFFSIFFLDRRRRGAGTWVDMAFNLFHFQHCEAEQFLFFLFLHTWAVLVGSRPSQTLLTFVPTKLLPMFFLF